MKRKEITLETLLDEIAKAEKQCLDMLANLRKQRAELIADTVIELTVSTIHKDKKAEIFNQLSQIDKGTSRTELSQQWKKSAQALANGWFGTVRISCLKKKATEARLKKIAALGGTIEVDSKYKMDVPPPDKWWNSTLELIATKKKK